MVLRCRRRLRKLLQQSQKPSQLASPPPARMMFPMSPSTKSAPKSWRLDQWLPSPCQLCASPRPRLRPIRQPWLIKAPLKLSINQPKKTQFQSRLRQIKAIKFTFLQSKTRQHYTPRSNPSHPMRRHQSRHQSRQQSKRPLRHQKLFFDLVHQRKPMFQRVQPM